MTHRIFVYGTLKQGYGNYSRLLRDHAKFIGPAQSVQRVYQMHTGGFPAVWEIGEGGAFLKGEVFEVDDRVLARCDSLEGHPRMYKRVQRTFNLLPSSVPSYPGPNKPIPLTAWVYLWQHGAEFGTYVQPGPGNILEWNHRTASCAEEGEFDVDVSA